MAGEFKIKNGAIIASLAGNDGYLVTVDSQGKLQTLSPSTFNPSGDYASLSEVSSISGDLQTQINSKQDIINLVGGNNVIITESPLNTFTISANISGGGGSYGIQGRLQLNNTDKVYTVTHPQIDPNLEFPVVSLDIPTSGSDLFVQGIFDRQNTSFKVELSGIPTNSYGILWHISTQDTTVVDISGGGFTPIAGNGITITPDGVDYIFEVDDYISSTEVEAISSNLQQQISDLELDLDNYTLLTTTEAISSNLQSQINSKQDEITLIAGSNISILEDPVNTFTISSESISGVGVSKVFVLNKTSTSFSYYISGLLESKTDLDGSQVFYYDSNDNLVAISGSGEYLDKLFSYDIAGNLTNIEVVE
jgi:hypothetical protein